MQHFSQDARRVPSDLISEEDIAWYWRVGTVPAVLVILVFAFGGNAALESWTKYGVEGILFFVLAFLVWSKRFSRRDAVAINVFFGLIVGLAAALFDSRSGFSFYHVFNFIASPLLSALLGSIIAVIATVFFQRIPRAYLALSARSRA